LKNLTGNKATIAESHDVELDDFKVPFLPFETFGVQH
jgi:hypothetical protein